MSLGPHRSLHSEFQASLDYENETVSKNKIRAGKVVQWVKALAVQACDLSPILGTHIKV